MQHQGLDRGNLEATLLMKRNLPVLSSHLSATLQGEPQ